MWPVSQRKQSTVSTSLMKTLSVSYTPTDSGREVYSNHKTEKVTDEMDICCC